MATRFEIGEPDSDPSEEWELRGGSSQPDLGQLPGNAGPSPRETRARRVEEAETVVFQDGIPIARRVTLPEVELLEDVSVFRNRTRSEPPNFWLAVQYGRELRRMSDEFVSSYIERRRLPVSKSAGTLAARVYRKVMDMFPRKDSVDPRPGGDC
ncbi:BCL2 associated agonist of cell death b [Hemiscyllium ocellatum]|uniref:BCL2 associated agonist of cell death b n=1 Tax=Hemiscyllium ocellatum TaxID=170820 RepID=UPI002966FB71|nr:BCL2 associated agonist of cell death b [Hemiscyllium ocellatum]XP_060711535.1 BCL2 associated agonist of cell death b [Hemiscyllium ocellatum]